ncbi:MAG: phosphate acyltransferase PlsX, partial [Fusobacteriaceae bacterium]
TTEGTAKFIVDFLKNEIRNDFISKIGAFFLKNVFRKLRKNMDASEYGGAIFLGLNHISVKAHGGSDEIAIKNAIGVAKRFIEEDFVEKVKIEMEKLSEKKVEGEIENV